MSKRAVVAEIVGCGDHCRCRWLRLPPIQDGDWAHGTLTLESRLIRMSGGDIGDKVKITIEVEAK
jgi:hypothetical protein